MIVRAGCLTGLARGTGTSMQPSQLVTLAIVLANGDTASGGASGVEIGGAGGLGVTVQTGGGQVI